MPGHKCRIYDLSKAAERSEPDASRAQKTACYCGVNSERPEAGDGTKPPKDADVLPEDGSAWGWVVLASIFCINLLNFGHFRAFGLYIQPMMHTFQATPSQVAWVSSIQHGLFSFIAPVASSLSELWTPRTVALTGGFLACIGFAGASFVSSIYELYVTFSLFGGIGVAFTHFPSLSMIAGHFRKRRGLANGLCMAGNSLGGILFPLFIDELLREFGLRGTILIAGGILGNICVCAMFWRPLPKPQTTSAVAAFKVQDSRNGKPQTDGRINPAFEPLEAQKEMEEDRQGAIPTVNGEMSGTNKHHRELSVSLPTLHDHKCDAENSVRSSLQPTKKQPTRFKKLLDLSVLRDPMFWLYTACKMCLMATFPGIRLFIPLWAVQEGLTQKDIAVVFSVMAVADFFGRVIIAGLSDWCVGEGRSRLFAAGIVSAGVTGFGFPYCHDVTLLAVVAGCFGFCTGSCIGLTSSVIADQFGGSKVAMVSGMCSIFTGIAGLLGPPMLGLIMEKTNDLVLCQQVISVIIIFASFIWLSKFICMKRTLVSES